MAELKLIHKGLEYTVLYDDDKHDLVCKYRWRICQGYVISYVNGKGLKKDYILMHRLLLGIEDSSHPMCDHKNRIRCDNRLENLRICTSSQNNQNKPPTGSCGFLGVTKTSEFRFRARCMVGRKSHSLGYFKSAELAAMAYDHFVRNNFEAGAYLNFSDTHTCPTRIDGRMAVKGKVGYVGVRQVGRKFTAGITVSGKHIYLGTFKCEKDAARAYNEAAIKYRGDKAVLNEL